MQFYLYMILFEIFYKPTFVLIIVFSELFKNQIQFNELIFWNQSSFNFDLNYDLYIIAKYKDLGIMLMGCIGLEPFKEIYRLFFKEKGFYRV